MFVVSVACCQRSLRRAYHPSGGVLPTVARRCVWSRNLENEGAKSPLPGCENTTTMGCNAKKINRQTNINMLYAFFWVNPRRLKFICRRFETLCLFHLHRQVGVPTCLWRWNSVPKRRHINFRRRGFTQKKAYNIQYTAKVWNQNINIVKTMCGSDEPHPYTERSSPTRLSTSGHASYKGRSCITNFEAHKIGRMSILLTLFYFGDGWNITPTKNS